MKTVLMVVGKTTDRLLAAAIDDYVERVGHYMPLSVVVVPDIKNTRSLSTAQQREREGELIMRELTPQDTVVLLDERGRELTSVELASWLERRRQTARRLVMVVGGAYGFAEQVYQRADERLSLSRLTFSHQMVRLIAAEQLYRACTIIRGEPYHHE